MSTFPFRLPSAWGPIVCSGVAFALVLWHWTVYGVIREQDEGTAAHLYQLLMVLQAGGMLYFAVRWLPSEPRRGAIVVGLQLTAAAAALVALYLVER